MYSPLMSHQILLFSVQYHVLVLVPTRYHHQQLSSTSNYSDYSLVDMQVCRNILAWIYCKLMHQLSRNFHIMILRLLGIMNEDKQNCTRVSLAWLIIRIYKRSTFKVAQHVVPQYTIYRLQLQRSDQHQYYVDCLHFFIPVLQVAIPFKVAMLKIICIFQSETARSSELNCYATMFHNSSRQENEQQRRY